MRPYCCWHDSDGWTHCFYVGSKVSFSDGTELWACWAEANPVWDPKRRVELAAALAYAVRTVNFCPLTVDDWRRLGVPEDIIAHRLEWEAGQP